MKCLCDTSYRCLSVHKERHELEIPVRSQQEILIGRGRQKWISDL